MTPSRPPLLWDRGGTQALLRKCKDHSLHWVEECGVVASHEFHDCTAWLDSTVNNLCSQPKLSPSGLKDPTEQSFHLFTSRQPHLCPVLIFTRAIFTMLVGYSALFWRLESTEHSGTNGYESASLQMLLTDHVSTLGWGEYILEEWASRITEDSYIEISQ